MMTSRPRYGFSPRKERIDAKGVGSGGGGAVEGDRNRQTERGFDVDRFEIKGLHPRRIFFLREGKGKHVGRCEAGCKERTYLKEVGCRCEE